MTVMNMNECCALNSKGVTKMIKCGYPKWGHFTNDEMFW